MSNYMLECWFEKGCGRLSSSSVLSGGNAGCWPYIVSIHSHCQCVWPCLLTTFLYCHSSAWPALLHCAPEFCFSFSRHRHLGNGCLSWGWFLYTLYLAVYEISYVSRLVLLLVKFFQNILHIVWVLGHCFLLCYIFRLKKNYCLNNWSWNELKRIWRDSSRVGEFCIYSFRVTNSTHMSIHSSKKYR